VHIIKRFNKVFPRDTIGNSIKVGVVIGFITSLAIQPISNLILNYLTKSGSSFFKGIINLCIVRASFGYEEKYSGFIFASIVGVISTIIIILFVQVLNIEKALTSSDDKPRQEEKNSKFKERMRQPGRSKIFKVFIIGLFVVWNMLALHIFFEETTVKTLNITFYNNMRRISVCLEESEERKLISLWASMENLSEYRTIVKEISYIATKNHIKLGKMLFDE
jgi:hypothetical protein